MLHSTWHIAALQHWLLLMLRQACIAVQACHVMLLPGLTIWSTFQGKAGLAGTLLLPSRLLRSTQAQVLPAVCCYCCSSS
jgi:hypothetical protein